MQGLRFTFGAAAAAFFCVVFARFKSLAALKDN
jgi:hypothetical protein